MSSIPLQINGDVIEITRATSADRATTYATYNNSFRPEVLNKDIDRIWLKLQELGVVDQLQKIYFQNLHNQQQQNIEQKQTQLQANIDGIKVYSDVQNELLKNELKKLITAHDYELDDLDRIVNQLKYNLGALETSSVIGAKLYPTVQAGLKATKQGEFFNVISGDEHIYAELYQNEANQAVKQNKAYTSHNYIEHITKPLIRVRTPEQYGADGTVQGDTKAWIYVCQALQNGEELRASGEYKINGSAVVISGKSGFRLDLSGAVFRQQAKFSKTIIIENCERFSVTDGEFHGLGGIAGEYNSTISSYNGTAGIFLQSCNYVQILRNKLFNHAGGSIVWRESNHLFINGNTVVGIGPEYIPPLGNGQDFAIGGFSDDVTRMDFVFNISGNNIKDTAFGVFANRAKSLIFNNNIIERIPGQHGAYIIESSGIVANGNIIENCFQSAFKLQLENYAGRGKAPIENKDMLGFTYTCNTIKNCQDGLAVISTSYSDSTTQKVIGLVATGNIISSTTQDGMVLNRCIDAKVGLNTINGALRFGIQFRNSNGDLSKNTILKCGSSGIGASLHEDSDFSDNTIIDCGLNNTSSVGGDIPIFIEQPVNASSERKLNPIAFLSSNRIFFSSTDAPSNLIQIAPPYQVSIKGTRTNSKKSARVDGTLLFCEGNDFIGFTASALNNPTTVTSGTGRRQFHGQLSPQMAQSTQAFMRGDICWNTNISNGSNIGWVCVTSGTPGTWQPIGLTGVTKIEAQADSTAADNAALKTDFNKLLAKMRTAQLLN